MRLTINNRKHITLDARSIRIAYTTEDIAVLLGMSPAYVRQLMRSNQLTFTGNAIKDHNMIIAKRKELMKKFSP